MKLYFHLQYQLFNRRMSDAGLHPVLGYLLLIAGFVALSAFLFVKTAYAPYVYLLLVFAVLHPLGDTRRNDFLKTCFPQHSFLKIRFAENGLLAIPFLAVLFYHGHPVLACGGAVLAGLMVWGNGNRQYSFTLPTPFSKRPFEFTVGFRNAWWLFGLSWFLTVMAVLSDNLNLGIFALLLVFLVSLSFFAYPEHEYYVWSFHHTPGRFILLKFRTAIMQSSLLSLPILVTLGIWFEGNLGLLLIFQWLGYAALATIIFSKYSAYPDQMSMGQAILVVMTIQFPPLGLLVLPYMYTQSVKRLKQYLG